MHYLWDSDKHARSLRPISTDGLKRMGIRGVCLCLRGTVVDTATSTAAGVDGLISSPTSVQWRPETLDVSSG